MLLTPSGMITEVKDSQPCNNNEGMYVMEEGKVKVSRETQPPKTVVSIEVTVSGKDMEAKEVQL